MRDGKDVRSLRRTDRALTGSVRGWALRLVGIFCGVAAFLKRDRGVAERGLAAAALEGGGMMGRREGIKRVPPL